MAAANPVKDLKERATCPICLDLFRDPVVTECGHSFCRECIARHCQGDGDVVCPQCRKKFQKGNLRPNWELRNMVESLPPLLRSRIVEESRGGPMCDRHQEPLQLYCKEHQSPICVFCERSQAHRGHTVVLVEDAVQEYWETLTKQLVGIESIYGSLHPLVSMDQKHLSPSAGEEVHKRLKRLADSTATLFKVDTEGPRQRFADAASQPQPRDPDWRGVSPGREAAGETESQGPAGREPGSEPAAEKQEETRSHVGRVSEEAPTPKYGLDQTSLDPGVHSISSTTGAAQSKEAPRRPKQRSGDPASQTQYWLSPESEFPWWDVSEETELEGHSGRESSSEPEAEKQEETGSHVGPVGQKDLTRKHELSQGSLDEAVHSIGGTRGDAEPKVCTESPGQRFEDKASQPQESPSESDSSESDDSEDTERQRHSGREPGSEPAAETWGETGSQVGEEASTSKDRLDQASLDPLIHKISDTREAAECKVDVKGLVSRCYSPTSPAPSQVSAGEQASVSPAGQGVTQTESRGHTGRAGRESGKRKAAASGVHRGASPAPLPPKRPKSLPASEIHQQESIRQQLEGNESSYKKLGCVSGVQDQIVTMDRTYLPHNEREEELQRLQRVIDNIATLLKVHTEGPRQRFADAASQTQPCDPEARGSPARKAADETESQGYAGREPGSEPAAETWGETGSQVGEEASTSKEGLDQATLDPLIHKISDTTEAAQSKVDVKSLVSRFDSPTSPGRSQVSAGDQAGVSPAGQGAAQTESGGDTGRRGWGPGKRKAAAAGAHRGTSSAPLPLKRPRSLPASGTQQQADAPSRGDSFQSPVRSELPSGGSGQVGVSPGRRVALPPELQGCAVEVTLDPATAHPQLILSEDWKSAERGNTWQDLPNNPERFDDSVCVLGSEGFTSGRRYWEVEVGPREGWAIGVARDSVQRKGWIRLKPDLGIWALDSLDISQVPRKVGVYLDYEGGEVRFYNAENKALIFSLTDTFTGRLVPFFHLRAVGSRLSLSPCQR